LLVRVGRQIGARIVHSHFGPQGWYDSPAVRQLAARHVVTFYGYDVGKLPLLKPAWRARYLEMFRSVDAVLCEGSFMAKCIQSLGCPPEKLRVHHLGVPIQSIMFRPRHWKPGSPLRVLIAATFTEKKGIPNALIALARFRKVVPLKITIIGDAQPGRKLSSEKRRILDVLKRSEFGSDVQLLGYQPHNRLFEEAYSHHVFLSPSITARDGDTEGGAPVTIIEMAATGMPVVSTHHCDIPGVLGAHGARLLTNEGDIDGIVERLTWLANNPDAWKPIVAEVRRHIEIEYDAVKQGLQLARIYKEL
jgi:colanic acid/amylovoran biosynthesis glycosyltransferase